MSKLRTGQLRAVTSDGGGSEVFTSQGRPREARKPFSWGSVVVRLLILAWAVAIVAALVDAFSVLPNVSFISAAAMTGVLVVSVFLVTRNGVPDWRGDPIEPSRIDADDPENDLLTDLPTFNFFQRRISDEFQRARRMGKLISLVLIDVNNLTAVNKEYGVKAGDEVLRHVARAADSTKRYNDTVARLGDDEFGVLLLDCADDGVRAFIDRLEERLARESASADVGGRAISLWAGVCTGCATTDPTMAQPDALLEAAMAHLNAAKQDRERRRRMWLSA